MDERNLETSLCRWVVTNKSLEQVTEILTQAGLKVGPVADPLAYAYVWPGEPATASERESGVCTLVLNRGRSMTEEVAGLLSRAEIRMLKTRPNAWALECTTERAIGLIQETGAKAQEYNPAVEIGLQPIMFGLELVELFTTGLLDRARPPLREAGAVFGLNPTHWPQIDCCEDAARLLHVLGYNAWPDGMFEHRKVENLVRIAWKKRTAYLMRFGQRPTKDELAMAATACLTEGHLSKSDLQALKPTLERIGSYWASILPAGERIGFYTSHAIDGLRYNGQSTKYCDADWALEFCRRYPSLLHDAVDLARAWARD